MNRTLSKFSALWALIPVMLIVMVGTVASQGQITRFSCQGNERVNIAVVDAQNVDLNCIVDTVPTTEPTATPTSTTEPTSTPLPPTATSTLAPTNTPTALPTNTPTAVPTATATSVPSPSPTVVPVQGVWSSDFSGAWANPSAPLPAWGLPELADWGFVVHSRDSEGVLTANWHDHGPNCEGPPSEHLSNLYIDSIFLCRNHIMTSIGEGGYGLAYMMPPVMATFGANDSFEISWRMSTLLTSSRDWVDLQIIPVANFSTMSLDPGFAPDLQGVSPNTVWVTLDAFGGWQQCPNCDGQFGRELMDDVFLGSPTERLMERELFVLTIDNGFLSMSSPEVGATWIPGSNVPDPNFCAGGCVIVFGHHSYNPTKDPSPDGQFQEMNTWHWSDFSINHTSPMPFNRANEINIYTRPAAVVSASWNVPSIAGDVLHCGAIGMNTQYSFDGSTWFNAPTAPGSDPDTSNYVWRGIVINNVPVGTDLVYFRGASGWGDISLDACMFVQAGS